MNETQEELREALETVDWYIFFLVLIIVGTLFSFRTVMLGREQTCLTIQGKQRQAEALTPQMARLRCLTSALVIGSLGFFLMSAQKNRAEAAAGSDKAAFCSADRNLWASILVFVAAAIRLYDLKAVEQESRLFNAETLEDETLPV